MRDGGTCMKIIEMLKFDGVRSEAKIVRWLKKEGDLINKGDILAEAETDKVNIEIISYVQGALLKILITEGEFAPTGSAIALVADQNDLLLFSTLASYPEILDKFIYPKTTTKSIRHKETTTLKAISICFCYAHEDEKLLDTLKVHLKVLQRQMLIDMWYDRDISAGAEWEQEIDKHLKTADIILLLVSPDFIASDYCYSIEMQQAMERHRRGEAVVIPILLRPVYFEGTPFGKLQVLPTDAKPIMGPDWYSLDIAFYNVAEGIRKSVEIMLLNRIGINQ